MDKHRDFWDKFFFGDCKDRDERCNSDEVCKDCPFKERK